MEKSEQYKERLNRKKKKDYNSLRKEHPRTGRHPEHEEIYTKSLVKDYFIAGRKTFNGLRDEYGQRMNTKLVKEE